MRLQLIPIAALKHIVRVQRSIAQLPSLPRLHWKSEDRILSKKVTTFPLFTRHRAYMVQVVIANRNTCHISHCTIEPLASASFPLHISRARKLYDTPLSCGTQTALRLQMGHVPCCRNHGNMQLAWNS